MMIPVFTRYRYRTPSQHDSEVNEDAEQRERGVTESVGLARTQKTHSRDGAPAVPYSHHPLNPHPHTHSTNQATNQATNQPHKQTKCPLRRVIWAV